MADRLSVVGFATAHVTGLTVLGVLGLHVGSALGGLLEPLGTATGVLLFGVLWGVTVLTHHYGFTTSDPWSSPDRRPLLRLLGAGFAWGALTGAGAFWILAVLAVLGGVVSDPSVAAALVSLSTLLIALIGTAASLLVGGVVGLVAAAFDCVVVDLVDRLVEP